MPHLFIKQWTVLLLLSCFLIVSTISNAAIPAAAPYVARTIVSNPQIRRQAVELLINLGLLGSLTHKNKKTNIKDMNCGINGVVYWGPNITEVEQVFRQNHRYVNVWFSKRDGKYNVYGVDYGEHKDNVTLLAFVWCGGPDIGNYEKGDITIDANKASTELVNQAKKGNVQAKNLVKDALKADNPKLTATQIEQLIKGTTTATPSKPITQPKPPVTTQPKPTNPPAKPIATPKPTNPPAKPIKIPKFIESIKPIVKKKTQAQCKKIKDKCIDICSKETLPTKDNGFSFFNCVNKCLEKEGC